MGIEHYLQEKKRCIDSFIEDYFSASEIHPPALKSAMVYSITAGGKRIRPLLCLASYEACGGRRIKDVVSYASALEFIHTYSLIHDDLPSMDNDDLRRGKPTNHKVFGEALAILAGDALLTEAFYLLSSNPYSTADIGQESIGRIISEVAYAAGAYGMVGGQAMDILSEDAEPDYERLSFIHDKKTAALIRVSVRIGGILANCRPDELKSLSEYGENIGLGFQIIDDILDVEGDSIVIGKAVGSDEKKKKMTYPKLYGLTKSKEKAEEVLRYAVETLKRFDEKADPLRDIALYLLNRSS
jgi:geranylgeranyl diphosphate synthase type II